MERPTSDPRRRRHRQRGDHRHFGVMVTPAITSRRRGLCRVAIAVATALSQAAWIEAEAAVVLDDLSRSVAEIVERVQPTVVEVRVRSLGTAAEATNDAATGGPNLKQGGGSGVIVDPAGWIVTGAHVVEGATGVEVILASPPRHAGGSIVGRRGRRLPARVVGVDPETDLAILHVDGGGLPALAFADSDRVRPGHLVIALGSPHGLHESVTMGIVSAIGRQRTPEDPLVFLQTDATINPGNSGGPLVDSSGGLVGISSFILTQSGGSQGLGFAVPSNIVRAVVRQIREHGRVRRGTIGVVAQTLTPELAAGLDLGDLTGVLVADVVPGSPAADAGLLAGDMIVSLDGRRMENARQLEVNLYPREAGEQVELDVLRAGRHTKKVVAIGERDDPEAPNLVRFVRPRRDALPALGALVVETNPEIEALLPPLRTGGGLVVVSAEAPRSPDEAALLAGDIIVGIGRTAVTSRTQLEQALALAPREAILVLQVQRGTGLLYVPRERRTAPLP